MSPPGRPKGEFRRAQQEGTAAGGSQRHAQLQRLAERVSAGEVVFFIGAGFSLDAEGNSAKVLIARLLVRFEAMCESLKDCGQPAQRTLVHKLRHGLRGTFKLGPTPADGETLNDLFDAQIGQHLTTLSQSYYQINDWLCAAFDELLRLLSAHQPAEFAALAGGAEDRMRQALERQLPAMAPLRIGQLCLALLLPFWRHCDQVVSSRTERAIAGKALFLDTMGFDDAQVMSGSPMSRDLDQVLAGARSRLTERHHALAWLAAEGLCPVVVTTNFDLLLDSAYRLAGLLPWNAPASLWPDDLPQVEGGLALRVPRNRRFSHFARIADAWQFFSHGQAPRATQLYKIHGCADAYRIARRLALAQAEEGGYAVLRSLMPTIVFTFREIQNWREDTWSRDYLNTLLRTKTIVFSGYSGADPVIHDTFRTIYEEMAGYRRAARLAAAAAPGAGQPLAAPPGTGLEQALPLASNRVGAPPPGGQDAPAFFVGPDREFHGLEILRAASMAAGDRRPEVTDHPNLLTFHYGSAQRFPTLDELYVGLYHECARRLQGQALESQVQHAYYQLVGHRCPAAEAASLLRNFHALRAEESAIATAVDTAAATDATQRRQFRALTGWTWFFHRALLREYALAENFLRYPADALAIQRVARLPWYCPIGEHADWAAWGVVIELALRRAYAELLGLPAGAWQRNQSLQAAAHDCPTAALAGGRVMQALTIELTPMRRMFLRGQPRPLRALPPVRWELRNETVPWWRGDDARRPSGTPSAELLWQWAALPPKAWRTSPAAFFGEYGRW